MNILVAFASRHGRTRAIAETIAAELEHRGHRTVFSDVSGVSSLDGFDAVVVGSGLRHGNWLPQALAFLDRFQPELATVPVWFYCSGPRGDDKGTTPRERRIRDQAIRLMDHRCFHGNTAAAPYQPHEQRADLESFNDWSAVEEWADHIGDTIAPVAALPPAKALIRA